MAQYKLTQIYLNNFCLHLIRSYIKNKVQVNNFLSRIRNIPGQYVLAIHRLVERFSFTIPTHPFQTILDTFECFLRIKN